MALTVVPEPPSPARDGRLPPPNPDEVLTTPCGDMWPKPYYFQDGLRRVEPYHFTYNTNIKERWRGREVLDIFTNEFRDRPAEYYKEAIESGHIQLNGKPVPTPETTVKNGDVISHTLHRHEPPVTAQEIGIVHEDDGLIVINKPAGVPVHPAGRYNHNSVVEIMRAQRDYEFNPRPCNRLDRLTSGIMFLGKNQKAADDMTVQIKGRTVFKEYVARVIGEFPEGEIVCEKPILQISPKLGLNAVRADGKEARTVFKRLAYYPPREARPSDNTTRDDQADLPWKRFNGYSIVRCLPLTGRTHQLRVHLQFLGHPISNDPIYCNQKVFGPSLGAGIEGGNDEDIISRLSRMGKEEVAEAVAYHDEMVDAYHKRKAEKMTGELCDVCGTALYSDPGPHELGIYLHALRYADQNGKWSYKTELPAWALPPEGMEGPTEPTEETDPLMALEKLGLEDDTKEVSKTSEQEVVVVEEDKTSN